MRHSAQHAHDAAAALGYPLRPVACCRKQGQPLIGMLMADSRHSLWDESSERHLLFRHAEGRKEGMYLLPTAINLVYAVQQGYDFIHFQVKRLSQRYSCCARNYTVGVQLLVIHSSCGPLPVPQLSQA